jgi:hypothetical protein
MRATLLVTALLSAVFAPTLSAQTGASAPVVQVGIYSSHGNNSASAYETGENAADSFASVVYAAPCSTVGAGGRTPPASATDAWRLAGRVLTMTAEEAVLQLDWQRIRKEGQPVSAPGESVRLTLRVGDREILDSADRPPIGACTATQVGFEARFAPRPGLGLGFFGGAMASGAAASGVGSRAGGRGGAVSSGSGSGGSGAAGAGAGARGGSAGTFDVDLWLVHGAPNRADEVLHETIRATSATAGFTFAPIQIATPQGALTVLVVGSVAVVSDATGARQFVFATDRKVTFTPSNRPSRDQVPQAEGSTKITSPMPGPDDVLSFEMPPLRPVNGGPSVADHFAIRVRVTPVRIGP